jgi:putative GTP pyrophosphokinase
VFSEGWHEVEHDFRYKCQDDWVNHTSLSRTFNGMLAALETHEWGMIKIFEELGYSFYKTNNFGGMMRMRLRIRTEDYKLSDDLETILASEPGFLKNFFKLERQILIEFLLDERVKLPFQLDNLVFLINHIFFQNENISASIPEHILLIIKEIEPRKNFVELVKNE